VSTEPETYEHAEGVVVARPADTEVDPRQVLIEETAGFARDFQRWVDIQAKGEGLTMPGLRMVERLHCQGPAKMRTLADELGLTPRNVTALVDGLEADDLVVRCPHPTDRRATIVELTAGGTEAADAVLGPRMAAMACLFDVLDDDERGQFVDLIRRLRTAMAPELPSACTKSAGD
jgi:DNA-binding MarR family transcriptional regulator